MAASDNIRSRRIALGMTQEQLAEKACVSRQLLQAYEYNIRKPGPETFVLIARALGTTCEKLVFGEDSAQ